MLLHHVECLPITEIAQRVGLTPQHVRRHIAKGREAAKKVTAEVADVMRQLETQKIYKDSERACLIWDELQLASDRLGKLIEGENGKLVCMAANALARVGDAVARLREASTTGSVQISKLWGLHQPTRIVEESLRVNLTKVDGKITVLFDRDQIRPKWTPLGLTDCNGHSYERLGDRVVPEGKEGDGN